MHEYFNRIYILTGRNESLRKVTERWLKKYYGFLDVFRLFMREKDDFTLVSSQFKEETFLEEIRPRNHDDDGYVFADDDLYVLNMYAKYGVALKAPECWDLLLHGKPDKEEHIYNK